MIYDVILFSVVQLCESAINIHTSPPSWASVPPPTHPSPLGHHRVPGWAPSTVRQLPTPYSTHGNVCISMLFFQFISPFPSPLCTQVHSLHLHLYSCPADRVISTIFSALHIFIESACQCRRCKRLKFDSGLRRSPGVGSGNPLQYSYLENFMDRKSLVGYRSWGCKELDMTEWQNTQYNNTFLLMI